MCKQGRNRKKMGGVGLVSVSTFSGPAPPPKNWNEEQNQSYSSYTATLVELIALKERENESRGVLGRIIGKSSISTKFHLT